jgi:hypothetical protein
MRKEGVHSLVLNVPLFREMKLEIAQDPRYVRFAVPTKTSIEHYNVRVWQPLFCSFCFCANGDCIVIKCQRGGGSSGGGSKPHSSMNASTFTLLTEILDFLIYL